ncbi:MAG TPA: pyruvate carboxylase subunit B [Dehalococcoidia bacterium]|nr:pyruvate carboxylase subunit B [Dehalococcoidia bacterium]
MTDTSVKITDLTLRDGHQSLFATRMRTEDMVPIAPDMNRTGFYSMEVWGGATFDVTTRFLNEDPWDRVRILKKLMPDTPLQMLLRGQNLVGYRNYADDVVTAFVRHAAEVGIDIFRVFDAVNDERNFETALKVIKECGKHAQLTLCYSLTEPKLGGPVYNIEYFVDKALVLQDMGADSLCVKDMAGLISPDDAYDLIKALKTALKIPVNLHTHYTSGMASMSCLKAIEAGVDIIDTVLAPFALRSSHPAVEPMVVALQGTPRDTGLDLAHLFKLGQYLETIAPKYRDFLDSTRLAVIDTGVLMHQVPGGMTTNLVAQLREAGALDKIDEVYEELPRVREELGYPPLVTPTSQIVGIQAVQNVLFGRYKMISGQVKDYVYWLYGRPPAPIDPEVQKKVLKGYERGETPITCRAADMLAPELEKAGEDTRDIARDIGDVLIYALYPTTGMRFLRWKYGLETPPPEVMPKTLEDVRREDELIAKLKAGKLAEKDPPATGGIRKFNVYIDDQVHTVGVEAADGSPLDMPAVAADDPPPVKSEVKDEPAVGVVEAGETAILAPLPGVILSYNVEVGTEVQADDVVVVLEAMKMANAITAPVSGRVKAVNFKAGDSVERDDVLAIIA